MDIIKIQDFIDYYEQTRMVTNKIIAVIPKEKIDWTYKEGKFSIGDLIRHIAGIERNVIAEIVIGNPPKYKGCSKEIADGYENTLEYFNKMHKESIKIFKTLSGESLNKIVKSVDGKDIELKKILRAVIVHEIHHRGALCIYLNLLGIETPPVMGLKEEQVIQLSK